MRQRGLSRIEALVQETVEGTFGRLFGGHLEPLDVANRLAKAIEDYERSGQVISHYQVALNTDDFQILTSDNPNLAADLTDAARQLGRRMGVNGSDLASVELVADSSLRRRRLRISTNLVESKEDRDQMTQTYGHNQHRKDYLNDLKRLDAFLIVQGRRHIPLDRPVFSIGRRTENDIVLDLPSVSRQHAQLRWRFGNFILYNISSRGSTLVNGHPVHECALRPGDVIALGDAYIVYGEGIESNSTTHLEGSDDDGTLARSRRKS